MFLAQSISHSLLIFPLPCTDETSKRSLYHDTRSSSARIFNCPKPWFVSRRKKLEEVDFVGKEFLHQKMFIYGQQWRLYLDHDEL